jgi:hypothetical protein
LFIFLLLFDGFKKNQPHEKIKKNIKKTKLKQNQRNQFKNKKKHSIHFSLDFTKLKSIEPIQPYLTQLKIHKV